MNNTGKYIKTGITSLIIIVLFVSTTGFSQDSSFKRDTTHSPRKATIYSAVLPGLGQYYNKKYWKIPIVYAAIGGCLTAALINNRIYNKTRDELILRQGGSVRMDGDYLLYDDSQLLELSNYHRKWRDNMYIFTGLAYVLNIIDANVDAHLFNFNVSEDLSLNIQPYSFSTEIRKPVMGVSFSLSFR